MHGEIYLEEAEKNENRSWITYFRWALWVLMIGISIFFASRSLSVEGEEETFKVSKTVWQEIVSAYE